MTVVLTPIGKVMNTRKTPVDDNWSGILSEIEIAKHLSVESLGNITDFSHLEIIYYFDKVADDTIILSGKPRGNERYPVMGIFAQRKKNRPNKIGLCTVELIALNGRIITVKNLDAIDGTPVLDIKPVMKEFEPTTQIRQPEWATDMMKNYW
ncbi:MAG: tRNA (N6-threonylcarbamoyladenosine(37)-N6)-methyltransferase TrmO [Chitinophagaceae bacterium]|nr:tRNA (N6-threonylcarbamoyladenosine(37)-N6)-methyltransferase TrmO [Chitinophagaceae bacterium]